MTTINIEALLGRLGKISNNLEKHGDEDVAVFAIPVTEQLLPVEIVNQIAADKHFDRCLFDNKRGHLTPLPWTQKIPLKVDEHYDNARVVIGLPSEEQLTFEGSRIKDITFAVMEGGIISASYQLQVKPGLGRENLLLQEYQHRQVKISIFDAKIALKKTSKQPDLPFGKDPEAKDEGDDDQDGDDAPPTHPEQLFKPKKKRARKNGADAGAH